MKSKGERWIYELDEGVEEQYYCDVPLDEDEMHRFLTDQFADCPYYRLEDEYRTVRRQM